MPPRARTALRLAALALATCAIALCGTLLGVRLAGPVEHETTLGGVSVQVNAAWSGRVDAFIPLADWGLTADAFDAPVELAVEPRALDRPALLRAVGGDRELITRAEDELAGAGRSTLLRAAAWGLGTTAVLAILVSALLFAGGHREVRLLLGLPAGALVVATLLGAGSLWQVQRTFSLEAFESPTFYARGEEMQQLLAASERARRAGEHYGDRVEKTLTSFASLLAESGRLEPEDGRGALVASDLHANVLVMDGLRRLTARQPVFFAGDFGHDGNDAETKLVARRVAMLSKTVIAVSGNHDSTVLMRRLARHGVTVLTERGRLRTDGRIVGEPIVEVDGLRIAGISDPLEWQGERPNDPRRIFSFTELPDGKAALAAAKEELIRWFDRLDGPVDVVMVHQNGLAQALAAHLTAKGYDRPLTVVTGHNHKQDVDLYGPITVVNGGTAGAGGVLAVGSQPIGVAELHFAGEGPRLRAVDLMQVEPFSGAAEARRVVTDPAAASGAP